MASYVEEPFMEVWGSLGNFFEQRGKLTHTDTDGIRFILA
jgi:hypothetical protein